MRGTSKSHFGQRKIDLVCRMRGQEGQNLPQKWPKFGNLGLGAHRGPKMGQRQVPPERYSNHSGAVAGTIWSTNNVILFTRGLFDL